GAPADRAVASFPTRRSSDLVTVEAMPRHDGDRPPRLIEQDAVLGQIELQRASRAARPIEHGESAVKIIQALLRQRQQRARRVIPDRKSTRLNCSHRTSSYAV